MDKKEFNKKLKIVEVIAKKHEWILDSTDSKTYRVSYKDELSIYRVDIYLSKITVCLIPVGDPAIYLKRQNLQMIESIFKSPHEF